MPKRKTRASKKETVVVKKEEELSDGADENAIKSDNDDGDRKLTEYEMQRIQIMERNRQRLIELGIPGITKALQIYVSETQYPTVAKKPRKKKEPSIKIKIEPSENPIRRSSRIRDVGLKPKEEPEESAEERYEREVGEFIVDGICPRCGKSYTKGHRAHLRACTGGKKRESGAVSYRAYSAMDRELLADLTEEDRKDIQKRTLARMKAVTLSNLIDFTEDHAKFIVIGSKGDPYTITLADAKHSCTCMDYRFRRHNCKHILAVLSEIKCLDDPTKWRQGVENSLDHLMQREKQLAEGLPPEAPTPKNKDAEMAAKFM